MSDASDQPAGPTALRERLASQLPGFPGYEAAGSRRQADQQLRDCLSARLRRVRGHVGSLQRRLSAEGQFKPATDLHRLGRRLHRTLDRVEHAVYGYAGFFAAPAVSTAILSQTYELDLALLTTVATLVTTADALGTDQVEARPASIAALGQALDELDHLLDLRAEVAASAAPDEP